MSVDDRQSIGAGPAAVDVVDEVLGAVKNPQWDFRTVSGVMRDTRLDEQTVRLALQKLVERGAVRVADVPDARGRELFTASERPVSLRERLGRLRTFIAKSSA